MNLPWVLFNDVLPSLGCYGVFVIIFNKISFLLYSFVFTSLPRLYTIIFMLLVFLSNTRVLTCDIKSSQASYGVVTFYSRVRVSTTLL